MSCSDIKHILFEFKDSKDDKVTMFAIIVYELEPAKNGALMYSMVLKKYNFKWMKTKNEAMLTASVHGVDLYEWPRLSIPVLNFPAQYMQKMKSSYEQRIQLSQFPQKIK